MPVEIFLPVQEVLLVEMVYLFSKGVLLSKCLEGIGEDDDVQSQPCSQAIEVPLMMI
jgi:hypothetical protein